MDPTSLAALIQSFQDMAKSNQEMARQNAELVAVVQSNANQQTTPTAPPTTDDAETNITDAVALTAIKVPLTLGDSAEERLINFHEWKEEVQDKFTVAGVTDTRRQTTIALMWGGKDIKTYAIEKAGVKVRSDNGETEADSWTDAIQKIEKKMEEGINEAFAMFKFRQNEQGQRNINAWYKQLKATVKTLRLNQCTCGNGYSEERAIRDVIVALTTDSKLRKDALSKDLQLDGLLKEGEANELARSRAATLEKKNVNRVGVNDRLTDEEAKLMIAKLKKAGKFSTRTDKEREKDKDGPCDRCMNARTAHTADKCFSVTRNAELAKR
jgi:hypothetical protein